MSYKRAGRLRKLGLASRFYLCLFLPASLLWTPFAGAQTVVPVPTTSHTVTTATPVHSAAQPSNTLVIDLSSYHPTTGLTVTKGETLILDASKSGSLTLPGNIINDGTVLVTSFSASHNHAHIIANNIVNEVGASISSVVPRTLFPNLSPVALNLTLQAVNSITNAGSITSSGALNLVAGKSIINQLPAHTVAPLPVMQANGALALAAGSGNLVNAGVIQSLSSNINLVADSAGSMLLNNAGGQLLASAGAVNLQGLANIAGNMQVLGGDILAKDVNLNAPTSSVELNVNNLTGALNVDSNNAHVNANTPALILGNINTSGDPLFYNTGNIMINGDVIVGERLAIVSGGNIMTGSGVSQITAQDASGQGYDIQIVAGANLSPSCGSCSLNASAGTNSTSPVTVNVTASPRGGNIDFTASPNIQINAGSSGGNKDGGNVTLAAFANSSGTGGMVMMPQNSSINAGGSGSGNNGNVTIIAGAPSGTSIQTGAISTSSGAGTAAGTGVIKLVTAQPTSSNGKNITYATDGSISSGNYLAPSSTITGGGVAMLGNLTASAKIIVTAGSNIQTPTIYQGTVYGVGMGSNYSPQHMALNPAGNEVYLADYSNNQVLVINTQMQMITSTIATNSPEAIAVSPDGSKLYVMNGTANQVEVYSTTSHALLATIPVGTDPYVSTFNGNGSRLYVLNRMSDNISVIDTTNNSVVSTIPLTSMSGMGGMGGMSNMQANSIAINPSGTTIYAGYYNPSISTAGKIAVVDLGMGMKMSDINVNFNPSAIGITANDHLYAGSTTSSLLSVINLTTDSVIKTIALPVGSASEIVNSPNGTLSYVSALSSAISGFTMNMGSTGSGGTGGTGGMGGMGGGTTSGGSTSGNMQAMIAVLDTSNDNLIQNITIPSSEVHAMVVGFQGSNIVSYIHDHLDQTLIELRIPSLTAPILQLTSLHGMINVLTNASQVFAISGTGNVSVLAASYTAPNVSITIDNMMASMNGNLMGINTAALLSTVQSSALTSSMADKLQIVQSTNIQQKPNSDGQEKALQAANEVISEDDKNIVMFTNGGQLTGAYGFDSDSFIAGDSNTTISGEQKIIVLHNGRIMTDTGSNGMTVKTAMGDVEIAPESLVLVDGSQPDAVRIINAGSANGSSSEINTVAGEKLSVSPGEELIVSAMSKDEEDLIPVDGVERVEVKAGISINSAKVHRNMISLADLQGKDIMIGGHLMHIGGNPHQKRAVEHFNAAMQAQRQTKLFKNVEVAAVPKVLNVGDAGDPLRVIASIGANVSQVSPGVVDVQKGDAFICAGQNVKVHAGGATITSDKNTFFDCNNANGIVAVKACTGSGHLSVQFGNRTVDLIDGQEALLVDHGKSVDQLHDGIGRRNYRQVALSNGRTLILADFSIPSLLMNKKELVQMTHSGDPEDKKVVERLMKTAVALSYAVKRGPYQGGK